MLADSLLIVDNPTDVGEITRLVEDAGQDIRVKVVEQPTLSQVYRGKLGSFFAYLEDATNGADTTRDSSSGEKQDLLHLTSHMNEIKSVIEWVFAHCEPGDELPDPDEEIFEPSPASRESWNATLETWLEESDEGGSAEGEEIQEAVSDLLSEMQKSYQNVVYGMLFTNGLTEIREDALILTGKKDPDDILYDHPKEICELSSDGYEDFQIEYLQKWSAEEEYHLVIPNQVAFWLDQSDIEDVIGAARGDFCSIERCEQTLLFLSILGGGIYKYLGEHGTTSVEEITEILHQICFEADFYDHHHFVLDPSQVREILKLMKKAGFVKGKGNRYTAVLPSGKR